MSKSILWLTENYPPQRGGMAQSCDRIISGLRNVGYTIEIIHFTSGNTRGARKTQKMGAYSSLGFEESEPHTLNLAWNYIKSLGSFDYVASFGGHLSLIGAPIYAKWLETELLVFLRGNDFDSSIFALRKRDALQYALSEAAIVFSVSQEKQIKVKRWLPESNVEYVPNGIDIQEWEPVKSEIDHANSWRKAHSEDKICIGVIGQLKAKKGIRFLMDALDKTNLQNDIHLLLIGDIQEEDQEALEDLSLSYSTLSFQDRFELMKYYMCCDAIIIPSFYEGMPNVMLEAGALGIPIIASCVDGMADVISHEVDGLLFEVGNEDDCRKKIYDFVALENHQRQNMGKLLQEKIRTQYTAEHEIQHYQNLLQ